MKSKDIFCLAPWVHSHINTSGERALCCFAKGWGGSQKDLPEFWNSPLMKEARLNMLNGTPDPVLCEACVSSNTGNKSPRSRFEIYSPRIEDILSKTSEDGTYDETPVFYDYRMSNVCNLSCRMCNGESSSKIEIAEKKIEDNDVVVQKDISVAKRELIDAIQKAQVERIYWASGEAFLQEEHWEVLKEAVQVGQARNIVLVYNSNLAFPRKVFEDNEFLLKEFKEVILGISIDGTGKNVEFIRDGINWEKFQENIEYCKSGPIKFKLSFAVTLTLPTLLEIKPLIEYLLRHRLPFTVSNCFFSDLSALYSPLILDKETLNLLINSTLDDIHKYGEDQFFNPLIVVLESLRDMGKDFISDPLFSELLDKSISIDNFFGRRDLWSYYSEFPIIHEWTKKGPLTFSTQKKNYYLGQKRFVFSESVDDYWKDVHLREGSIDNRFCITHTYQELENMDIFFKDFKPKNIINYRFISILGSWPSVLNKFLNKDSVEKYKMFEDLVLKEKEFSAKYPYLRIVKSEPLPFFKFLLKGKAYAFLAPTLDMLTFPFRRLIAFHCHVLIEVVL